MKHRKEQKKLKKELKSKSDQPKAIFKELNQPKLLNC